MLQPRVIQLEPVIGEMDKMLRRLLGEHIDFVTVAHDGVGNVKADLGQIEQVLLNLAVNARDAMADGRAKLTIETEQRDARRDRPRRSARRWRRANTCSSR